MDQPIEVKDVESIDPEYFKNLGSSNRSVAGLCKILQIMLAFFLGWMLENDITSVLEETFSIVREQVCKLYLMRKTNDRIGDMLLCSLGRC